MRYKVRIEGKPPGLIQNCGFRGVVTTEDPNAEEISRLTSKRSKLTPVETARLRVLEVNRCFWLSDIYSGDVCIPNRVLRRNIEAGARKYKEGPKVREGVSIDQEDVVFEYDRTLGVTHTELAQNTRIHLVAPVGIQRKKVVRARPKFDEWACEFIVEVDDTEVEIVHLVRWLEAAGRIGIGDWKPASGGSYGRYDVATVDPLV